jgi:uncharacterized membrane protein YdfJ with MMPL/SSD domain
MKTWISGQKRNAWLTLAAGGVFILLSIVFGLSVFGNLTNGGFADPHADSTKAESALQADFPKQQSTVIIFFSDSGRTVSDPTYVADLHNRLAQVTAEPGVIAVTDLFNTPQTLVSADLHSTYASVAFAPDQSFDLLHTLRAQQTAIRDGVTTTFGGTLMVNDEVSTQIKKDISRAELISFPILLILLLIIFRGVVAALVPLALGGISILGAFLVVKVITQFTDISVFAINIITLLGLGLAIDYSLFIVSRFREELAAGKDTPQAVHDTMATAGRAVLFSGVTVAISLLSLLVFPVTFLRSMGLGGAAAIVVAVVASTTLLPATLRLLGPKINALRLGRRHRVVEGGRWHRFALGVMRRPWTIGGAALVVLLFIGSPFLHIAFTNVTVSSLPADFESRQTSEALARSFPNTQKPTMELAVNETGSALGADNIAALDSYVGRLEKTPGVTGVGGLVGGVPSQVSGDTVALEVYYAGSTQSVAAQKLVRAVRAVPAPSSFQVLVGGTAADLVDQLHSLQSRLPLSLGIISLVTLVLLLVMMGTVVVPIKAVVLNIISLSAAFGVLVWVFQYGHLLTLLHLSTSGAIDATQPILIFAIAFGLAMDYEVFLLSRIKESYDQTGDNTAAVAIGLEKTGPIITSAAVLLVVVIGAFATSEISLIQQIGVGLGFAVLVDATVVRTILVPATMRILGRANWWAPKFLKKLVGQWNFGE